MLLKVLLWATIHVRTIIRNIVNSFHMYADESHLYKSVSLNIQEDQLAAVIVIYMALGTGILYWVN